MMPAGKYYIGDLCYVMHEEWDQVMDLFCRGRTDHGCNEGEFNLPDGRRFASFNTAYGDGSYYDQSNKRYDVDAGLIGCIKVDDINENEKANVSSGQVVEFFRDFEVYSDFGVIHIGHIVIDTDPKDIWNDEEEEEYDAP